MSMIVMMMTMTMMMSRRRGWMLSTPAKVEDCPSRCRHPWPSFPLEAFTSWQRTETRQLETSNRSPAFLPNVLSNRQKRRINRDTGQQQINKTQIYKNLSTSFVYLDDFSSKWTVKTISLSMPKNKSTNTTPSTSKYLHSHPSLVLVVFLRHPL